MDDAKLRTIWQQRQRRKRMERVGTPLAVFMKYTLGKRVEQISQLVDIWEQLVPEEMAQHTALESFQRGVLTVAVDSAAHRFQLQMLLQGGLLAQIRQRYSGTLNKIRLVPGQFARTDDRGEDRFEFDLNKKK